MLYVTIPDLLFLQSRWCGIKPRGPPASQSAGGDLRTAPSGGLDVQQSGAIAIHSVPAANYFRVETWERTERKGQH